MGNWFGRFATPPPAKKRKISETMASTRSAIIDGGANPAKKQKSNSKWEEDVSDRLCRVIRKAMSSGQPLSEISRTWLVERMPAEMSFLSHKDQKAVAAMVNVQKRKISKFVVRQSQKQNPFYSNDMFPITL